MAENHFPSFDLVVATVGRVEPLEQLLESFDRQTYRRFRVLLVDQNPDDRLAALAARPDVERLRSEAGLSKARNAALAHLDADAVAFPDDDCAYPADLLERVARRLAAEPRLDGISGRDQAPSWPADVARLTRDNVWTRAISFTIFLRRTVVERVGDFDERLGLPHSSGEEIDYLVRALAQGARIEYDPSFRVEHDATARDRTELGLRDGISVGYLLRKHGYRPRMVARMLVRPAGGAALALARRDAADARFQLATLRGRLAGYRN